MWYVYQCGAANFGVSARDIFNSTTSSNMPSRRRDRSESRERSRSRSESSEREIQLPENAKSISEADYFLRSDEFKVWLKDEKRKVGSVLRSLRGVTRVFKATFAVPR